MRILVVSYEFSPSISPRAIRWTAIVNEWVRQGILVDVVCARPIGEHLTPQQQDGVRIYRTGELGIQALRSRMRTRDSAPSSGDRAPGTFLGTWILAAIRWLYARTWRPILWPDYACLWYLPARRAAMRLARAQRYDALVTVSHPFTSHWIGLSLKRRFKSLRWLADSGDPFAFLISPAVNNHRLYARLNYVVERRVFTRADALTVTTEATRARYEELFPECGKKLAVLPPLLAESDDCQLQTEPRPADGRLRLVYVGTLYRTIRNPVPLLVLFERMRNTSIGDRLDLHFYGDVHDCGACFDEYRERLGSTLHVHGIVSHQAALSAMHDADVLVNLGNDTPYQLPSKVVEYLATGRPVLNIARRADDSSAAFFGQYENALCLFDGSREWSNADVERAVEFVATAAGTKGGSERQLIECFRASRIAAGYLRLLQEEDAAARPENPP